MEKRVVYGEGTIPAHHQPAVVGEPSEGVLDNPAAPGQEPLARVTIPVQAHIGGLTAQVFFAGLAPCCVGLYQVNVQIPEGVTPAPDIPLVLFQNGVPSNTVTQPYAELGCG